MPRVKIDILDKYKLARYLYLIIYIWHMLSSDRIRQVLTEQRNDFLERPLGVRRSALNELVEKVSVPHTIVITGLRRCGKSTVLRQLVEELETRNFFYINFEDERLLDIEAKDFQKLHEAQIELFGESRLFLLDEVQNIPGFEMFVRRLMEQGYKFYLTGSNARLLSSEISTKLTGRHLDVLIRPFSFTEFLEFREYKITNDSIYTGEGRMELKALFEEYLLMGGMPEYLKYGKLEVVLRTYEDIVLKDISIRHGVENVKNLRDLYRMLITNFSNPFTYRSLERSLEFASWNTHQKYVSYLEESYLGSVLNMFSHSMKKQLVNKKKFYVSDNGFIEAVSTRMTEDRGRLIENLVCRVLEERNDVFYFQGKNECDFVALARDTTRPQVFQCAWELTPLNREREINGLVEAAKQLGIDHGTILTIDQDEEFERDGIKLLVTPVWVWLLRFYGGL